MGKTIIQQARGHGGARYRVPKSVFRYEIKYPIAAGEARILKFISSVAHSAPLIKAQIGKEIFFNASFKGAVEGNSFIIGGNEMKDGNVIMLGNIPAGMHVYNIERNPGDGGKMVRSSGNSAIINKKYENNKIGVIKPNKKEVIIDGECRATIGVVAGEGRKLKPFIKAGKKFYHMRRRGKLWPRTSAVKFNAVDHPFGSGRGKRIKSKIAKRNAPPGAKVGHVRPRRTGRKK